MQPDHNAVQIMQAAVDVEEEEPLNIRDNSGEINDGDDDDSYKSCNEDQPNAK